MGTPTTYVTYNGYSPATGFSANYGVIAYDSGTMTQQWAVILPGPVGRMELSGDGALLYVAETVLAPNGAYRIFVVDTAAHSLSTTFSLPGFTIYSPYSVGGGPGDIKSATPQPNSLRISPDGTKLWVLYTTQGRAQKAGLPTPTYEALTDPEAQFFSVAQTTNSFLSSVETFDIVTGAHTGPLFRSYRSTYNRLPGPVFDNVTHTSDLLAGTIPTTPIYATMVFSPDKSKMYMPGIRPNGVDAFGSQITYPVVLVVDTATGVISSFDCGVTEVGANFVPSDIRVSADGTKLYVKNRISSAKGIASLDITTGAVTNTSGGVGGARFGSMAYDASLNRLFVADEDDNASSNNIRTTTPPAMTGTPGTINTAHGILFCLDSFGGNFFATSPIQSNGSGSPVANLQLFKLAGATLTSYTLPGAPWCVLADSGAGTGTPGTGASAAGMQVVWDGHRRPCAIDASTGVRFLSSKDAGHTFDPYVVTAATSKDPSLFIDRRTNTPRAIYGNGSTGLLVATATQDGEQGDWGTSTAITGLSGAFPVAHEHPTDAGRVLMAYLDSGTLKTAVSYDGGAPATWQALGTVDTSLDFTSAGRAGLCWLGEAAFVAYRSGNNLLVRKSLDGGATWGSAVTVSTGGPHHGISLAGHEGQLVLAAQDAGALHLWTSGDLGAAGTWAAGTAPTSPVYPAALAVEPWTGRWFFGTGIVSRNQGGAWTAP